MGYKFYKLLNFLRNNRFSNFIKEIYITLFSPYPEFLFCEDTGSYLKSYFDEERAESIVATYDVADAMQVNHLGLLKKNRLIKFAGRISNKKWRITRRIELTYDDMEHTGWNIKVE